MNLTVEAARLGQMTDYDKLTLEVWTNGAISPQDSIGYAAKLLKDHMTIFINFEELPEATEEPSDRGLDRVRVTSVVLNDYIITTVPKAKAAQPLVDNMVTLAKRDTLHARRQAAAFLETPASVKKLFDSIGPKFS